MDEIRAEIASVEERLQSIQRRRGAVRMARRYHHDRRRRIRGDDRQPFALGVVVREIAVLPLSASELRESGLKISSPDDPTVTLQKRARIEGFGIYLDTGSVLRAAGAGVHRSRTTLSQRMQALVALHSERLLPVGALQRGGSESGSAGSTAATSDGGSQMVRPPSGHQARWSQRAWAQPCQDAVALREAFQPDPAKYGKASRSAVARRRDFRARHRAWKRQHRQLLDAHDPAAPGGGLRRGSGHSRRASLMGGVRPLNELVDLSSSSDDSHGLDSSDSDDEWECADDMEQRVLWSVHMAAAEHAHWQQAAS